MKSLPVPRVLLAVLFFAALTGYASTPMLETLGDNTYSCTRQSSTAFKRDVDALTAEAKEDAAKFCTSKGKQLKIVSISVDKPLFGLGYPKATVVFKALDAGDPELANHEPLVIENQRKKTRTTVVDGSSKTSDLYNDLIKLDDLRKRGILTEDEFQAEKKKLLDRSK